MTAIYELPEYDRSNPPCDLTTHQKCSPCRGARQQTVGPHSARRSAECRGMVETKEKLDPKGIERTCCTTEKPCSIVREPAHGVVRSPIQFQGQAGAARSHTVEILHFSAKDRHANAQRDLMRQPTDHLIPVAKAEDP